MLHRCHMQKVLERGDNIKQRQYKYNSSEAFIIVLLQHAVLLIASRFE